MAVFSKSAPILACGASPGIQKEIKEWLIAFSACVREVNFDKAVPMFAADVVIFGTHNDLAYGIADFIATQWQNVWPRTSDFTFNLDKSEVLAGEGVVVAVALWTSTGYAEDGTPFDRPGRATMVFARTEGRWVCVHSHMSLNRGVPQESYGDRTRRP